MLAKLVQILPKQVIDDECKDNSGPLMTRYYLSPKIFGFRLAIHQFHRSDNDRHYHDHPWNFISIILKGSYIEHFPPEQLKNFDVGFEDNRFLRDIQQAHRRWDIIKRPKEWKHWVELPEILGEVPLYDLNGRVHIFKECWTLVLLYGKRRDWGFHTEKGWVKWDKYDCRGDYGSNQIQQDSKGNAGSD
jgi:hypothetical protein